MLRIQMFLVSVLFVAACSSGGGSRVLPADLGGELDSDQSTPAVVQGRVVKGVVSGAIVRAYRSQTSAQLGEEVGEAVTDPNGYYRLELEPGLIDESLFLEVVTTDSSTMACDLLPSCGPESYGESVQLTGHAGFLTAAVAKLQGTNVVNINVITSLAAEHARRQQQLSAAGLRRVNTQVLSRFGLTGNILELPVFDLTRAEELSGANNRDFYISTLNAALLSAASERLGLSWPEAWARLKDDFAAQGISDIGTESRPLNLEAVYSAQLSIAEYLGQSHKQALVAASEVRARRALLFAVGETGPSPGAPSASAAYAPLARVKSMMQEIRQIYYSVDLNQLLAISDINRITNGEALGALGAFGMDINVLSADLPGLDAVQAGVTASIGALLNVIVNYYSGEPIPASIDGIDTMVVYDEDTFTMEVRQLYSNCGESQAQAASCLAELNLVLIAEIGSFSGSAVSNFAVLENSAFSISGTALNVEADLTFPSSAFQLQFERLGIQLSTEDNDYGGESVNSLFVRNAQINLPVRVDYVFEQQNKTVDLNFAVTVGNLELLSLDRRRVITAAEGFMVHEENVATFYELSGAEMTLGLAALDEAGEPVDVVVNVSQTTALPVMQQEMFALISTAELFCSESAVSGCQELSSATRIAGESDGDYLGVAATIIGRAILEGFNTPVTVVVGGERIGPTANDISSLQASYDGHGVNLKGKFNNSGGIDELQGDNLDGTYISLIPEGGDRTGKVYDDSGIPYANLRDMGEWIKVTYADGSFESM